ncbi:EthD domain-containing protein [Microbacterium ureisolvens]|uniref:EthD domain-containing protein n=1 Tax=Microbacterium ureisolvens TaxID=2781186 RepID=A0ABS7HYR2_9MICO|nr:EthD domain-containing protein [Microbacterium ureisolvens]MBW9110393.1 EthD domain-containing protein [Microbacterium ureisolvens]
MPGIKLFDPFSRRTDLSRAEFSHHWITYHAEIVKDFRRITRYVQSVRLDDTPALLGELFEPSGWDGCAETWHATPASVLAMPGEPRFEELMADERNFLDLTRPRHLIQSEEHLIDEDDFDPRTRGVKLLVFVRRRPEVSARAFADRWQPPAHDDRDLGRRLGVTRHVRCPAIGHVAREAETGPDAREAASDPEGYDGVHELWWQDGRAMREALATQPDAARRLLVGDVVDAGRSTTLVAHERIIVA